jgi:hypothetical protein
MEGTNRRHACTSTIILQVNIRLEEKKSSTGRKNLNCLNKLINLLSLLIAASVTRIFEAYAVKKLPNMQKLIEHSSSRLCSIPILG